MTSPTIIVRPRTPDDDSRPAWDDLWRALAAETAASNEPEPDDDAAPDASRLLLLVESDDDVR